MAIDNKYRIHEVAKDFGLPSKYVMDIMAEFFAPPKNHMQVLSDDELNVIFEVITFRNQIDSIAQVFAEAAETQAKKDAEDSAKKAETERLAAEEAKKAQEEHAKKVAEAKANGETPPAAPQAVPVPKPKAAPDPLRKKERRVVDTRNVTLNTNRFDEKADKLVDERTQNLFTGGKERIKSGKQRPTQLGNKRRQEERDKMRRLQLEIAKKNPLKVLIPEEIAVGELALRMKKTGAEVVKKLVSMGVFAAVSDVIDFDTASLVAIEFHCKVEKEVIVTIEEKLIDDRQDDSEDLVARDPVVVVMGHVDHGKTSLLDYIRQAHVASGEAGGITQHIGAYRVKINDRHITFLDTPGHEAFTAMRARGAMATDIAILVVAADDGIMPQTVEAINHAKAAGVTIIVAINKMDKPGANPEKIKQQLTEYDLLPDEWGGDTVVCPVSAISGMGVDNLLEMIVLTADMAELKANPHRAAQGVVIEARLDKGRGPVATLLVQNGTLRQGDILIGGTAVGRVRAMVDDTGKPIREAGPSIPVEIIGMDEVPGAGDKFHAVADERMARELVEQRKQQEKDAANKPMGKITLEDLFSQIQEGNVKELNIIVKADVQGSAEAVKANLEKLTNEKVKVRVIHTAVGAINESDVMLATTSGAIIVGFNVRPDNAAKDSAARNEVDVRLYRVIYECIEEIESAMKGLLDPVYKEVYLGRAEVRAIYKVPNIGAVGGCYVQDGKIQRNAGVRVLRNGVIVYEGTLASLRRFKDDVKEVAQGYECGIGVEKFNDIKEGDVIEAFVMELVKP